MLKHLHTPVSFVFASMLVSSAAFADTSKQENGYANHLKLNTYTSESLVQVLRPELDSSGARCEIKYVRPKIENSPGPGQGAIFCETLDNVQFSESLENEVFSHQGARLERVQFRFQGELQKKLSLALRNAARASELPALYAGWSNPRFTSGDLCSPDGSHCSESYYLNDSDDIFNSGASFICARLTRLSEDPKERPQMPDIGSLGRAIDRAIEAGVLEVEDEHCVFTGI